MVWIFPRPLGVICYNRRVLSEGHKNSRIGVSWTHSLPFFNVFNLFLTRGIMAIFSKGCKPDNFESDNSLKLSFTNIRGLRSNFVECESFLESNFPDILGLCETNLDDSIHSSSDSLSSVNPKGFYYSYAWCCSLGEGRTSFCTGLISRKFYGFLLKFSTSPNIFIVLLFFL